MSDELILAISGNDIFSGGGLHADLATFTTNKQHGFVALTCLTAMTENGFEVIPVDTNVFKQQLDSLRDVPFSAIKIGLLPNVEIAELTLDFVKNYSDIPIVLKFLNYVMNWLNFSLISRLSLRIYLKSNCL